MGGIVDYQLPVFTENQRLFIGECLLLGLKHSTVAGLLKEKYPTWGLDTPDELYVETVRKRIKKNSAELRESAMRTRVHSIVEDSKDDILSDARKLWADLELAKSKATPASWSTMVKNQIALLNIRLKHGRGAKADEDPATASAVGEGSTLEDGEESPTVVPTGGLKDRTSAFASLTSEGGEEV